MTENQPHQPQNQPGNDTPAQGSTYGNQAPQGTSPSYGSSPQERTQQLPTTGYGQHSQQQYAPHGPARPGQHSSGGGAFQGGQFGTTGAHQGASPGTGWPFAAQQPAQPEPPKPKRRGLALVAATALLVGTAGGVGGAAVYSATNDSSATPSVTAPLTGGQAAPASAPDGSVQNAAAKVLPSVVKIAVATAQGAGTGSGIVISQDGLIVTNNHVVAGAGNGGRLSVILNDGRTVPATIVGTDPLTDLAVIRADAKDLKPAVLGKSGSLLVGQGVVAIGSPFGLDATVTSGIVSALNRPVSSGGEQQDSTTVFPAVQTDAAINPGNSGGALIDLAGQVVGINSAIKTAGGSGQSEGGNIGLGFAIPIDQAKPIIDELVASGKATHARLGVTVGDAQSSDGLTQGATLGEVTPGGAADKAGLKSGDIVTAINGKAIASGDALVAAVRSHRPGDEVTITFTRDGKPGQTVKAKLGSDNGNPTG
ncbi:PDZ/DHR/GLGF domain protein [Kribbella flavida DSM 17836]|uniref:PDZ/DHR/GLGF domain protein n=1 Tax=Kribbella flavida (strain DSM 17836 / JCM 10339 / NBRC 14399) TaxID=479435 RepID=D2Q2I0_KRIFD|nr:trypsin-like peptidase domain-containing protein [Kribbella flavida]ADB35876.1 PDZ/DHR/GLGF domain protein [Kribbella flavida DSM 17836]